MTVIAGVVHNGRVLIAGDSAGVSGYALTVRADAKVWTSGPYAFGFTSSFRMGQILRYSLAPPEPDGTEIHRFMATIFVDKVRARLKNGGWARRDSEQEIGGDFLVGVAGHLFRVSSDYQVGESADGYDAVGCGDHLALGALHATGNLGLKPRQRIAHALAAADHHSSGVTGPFVYAKTPLHKGG